LISLRILFIVFFSAASLFAATRPFYMGFSPWLYDATFEAQSWVYDTIQGNGDIVSEHIEEGVPWPECFNDTAFSADFQNQLNDRKNKLKPGMKILLQINPMNTVRNSLAPYRGDTYNMPLPELRRTDDHTF